MESWSCLEITLFGYHKLGKSVDVAVFLVYPPPADREPDPPPFLAAVSKRLVYKPRPGHHG